VVTGVGFNDKQVRVQWFLEIVFQFHLWCTSDFSLFVSVTVLSVLWLISKTVFHMLFNFLISILCCFLDFVKLLWCVCVPFTLQRMMNRESEPLTSEGTKNEEIDKSTSEGKNQRAKMTLLISLKKTKQIWSRF